MAAALQGSLMRSWVRLNIQSPSLAHTGSFGIWLRLFSTSRPTVTILGRPFKTQKSLSDELKSLIQDRTSILEPHNQKFAIKCVSRYDKVNSEGTVQRVYVAENENSLFGKKSICMHVVMESGKTVTVAHKNVARSCFQPQATADRRKIDAKLDDLREAVKPDIDNFRKERTEEIDYCEECFERFNDSSTTRILQVDHTGELEFRHLVEKYVNEQCDGILKAVIPGKFAEFHREMMELRLVCNYCNEKKTKTPVEWTWDATDEPRKK